jgi:hypothetical protein
VIFPQNTKKLYSQFGFLILPRRDWKTLGFVVCWPCLPREGVTSKEEAYMVLCMDCHLVNIIILVPNFHFIQHGMKNGSIVDAVVSSSNRIGEDVFSSHLIFLYPTYTCFVYVSNTRHPRTKTINL